MIKKKNILYIFFVFSIYILSFQYFLENKFQILKYIDEAYAILFVPILFFNIIKRKNILRKNKKITILLTLLIILGIIPNIAYKYQSLPYIMMDIIIFLKFFFAIGLSSYLFNINMLEENCNKLKFHLRFIIMILLFATIFNYMFNLWPNSNIRFGIMTNQVFFGHPTKLSAVLFFLLSLYNILTKGKSDIFYIFTYLMIITTLRTKALLALGVSIFILHYVKKTQNKINIKRILIIGIVVCILGFNTFKFYFFSDGFARAEMLRTSFKIAHDYFPLGTGFGTFGSWASGISYSPVYYLYSLNNVWGLTPYDYLGIADTFWPTVLGQFGYVGIFLYLIIIIKIFSNIQNEYSKKCSYIYSSKLIAFVYLIVSSTSESAFFNQLSIPLGIIIGLNIAKSLKEGEENESNI